MDLKYILTSVIFTSFVGYLLNMGGFTQFALITPTIFLVGQALMIIVIEAANTPLAKGIAMGVFAVWVFAYLLTVQIPATPFTSILYAVLFVPSILAVGLTFLEFGKG